MSDPTPTFSSSSGAFLDHFGQLKSSYASFRPTYPASLFDKIVQYTGSAPRELAIDVGCGTGQATLPLLGYYRRVVGVEPSQGMVDQAIKDAKSKDVKGVEFVKSPAETLPFPDASVDLAITAQAVHWFDIPAYFKEAHRVLKPGGTLAIIGYGTCDLQGVPELDKEWKTFYGTTLGDIYWPANRKMVDREYVDITIPSPLYTDQVRDTSLNIEKDMSLDHFVGYLSSFSGYKEYMKANKGDPLPALRDSFAAKLGHARAQQPNALRVVWKIFLLLGRRV